MLTADLPTPRSLSPRAVSRRILPSLYKLLTGREPGNDCAGVRTKLNFPHLTRSTLRPALLQLNASDAGFLLVTPHENRMVHEIWSRALGD